MSGSVSIRYTATLVVFVDPGCFLKENRAFHLGEVTRNSAIARAEKKIVERLAPRLVPTTWRNTLLVKMTRNTPGEITWVGFDKSGVPVCYLRCTGGKRPEREEASDA